MYKKEENYQISEKEEMMYDCNYEEHKPYPYKISALPLQVNVTQECYRDQLVSFFQLGPMIEYTVPIEEADYILYANPYARIEDFSDDVLNDLVYLNTHRKEGTEIIIMGKAVNIKDQIGDKYENITYIPSHYAKYVGERFGFDVEDKFMVYDDRLDQLNLWPVDGCQNKCGFCRRTYMNIPFESVPLEQIKEQLDWWKEHHPEQMKHLSLRAENLTQYGLDIYGVQALDKVIDLLNSYDEIETIELPIGMCIGEINDKILESLCRCKKIDSIALNLEAGTDRLLSVIGKKHNREKAIKVCNAIRESHPNADIKTTIMIGLPTEGIEDILALGDLIIKCHINYVHGNYYGYSPKHPLAKYPQLNEKVRELHLAYLIKYLKKNYKPENNSNLILRMRHETIEDKSKRSVHRALVALAEDQKSHLPRLLRVTHENFIGHNISIKGEIENEEDFKRKVKRIVRAQRRCK